MKAPLNIFPPKNWQDFETLCLKLWGEIWDIPHEIEFNSDNSQGQNGVDIYGPVDGGTAYNGIQCKNKKLNLIDGSPNRILIKDIQEEIDKAKTFTPALKRLIIATSLPKDKAIEEYIRTISLEHVSNGLFTIQICFWEYFERKLPEFEKVYNWYLKNEDFHRKKQLTVTFKGGSTEKIFHPKFQKTVERYALPNPEIEAKLQLLRENNSLLTVADLIKNNKLNFNSPSFNFNSWPENMKIEWKQFCWLDLVVSNTGDAVIEDYKIELEFEGDFLKVGPERGNGILNPNFRNDVKGYSNSDTALYIEPRKKILVQGDHFVSGNFYIEPKIAVETEIKLHWKLLSRDFNDSGMLIVKISPKYHRVVNRHEVSDPNMVRDEELYSLIKRPGQHNIGGNTYADNVSDYNFD
ncbi:MAG: hypothetical protein JNM21_14545 [Taibaiella sp.]|nr:hypothetical protein [Taibaiella sp.]